MLKAISLLKDNNRSDKLKLIGLLLIPVILVCIQPEWLSAGHSVCLYKNITGHECYGCGMTRAVISAIHLRFNDAWRFNRLFIIVFPLLIFIWVKTVSLLLKKVGHSGNRDTFVITIQKASS